MTQAFNLAQLANNVNSSGQLNAAIALNGITPVANGGSGLSTIAANNVILGNGTSAVQVVAPGTSGNVLTSNGTTWASTALPASGFTNMTVFTSSGTWTVPSGVTKAKVTVVGGGGSFGSSGGSGCTITSGGAGGGGGAAIKVVTGLSGSVTVTVGGAAGTSSFGAYCSATGGGNGGNGGVYTNGSPGGGGTGSNGSINITGIGGIGITTAGVSIMAASYGYGNGNSGIVVIEY